MSRIRAQTDNVSEKTLKRRKYRRQYYHKNKDKCRANMHKYNYGLMESDYSRMSLSQGGKCFLCQKPAEDNVKRGHIARLLPDHNHETGEVRSLLCNRCNIVLGMIETNMPIAEKMMSYLKHNNYKALHA